VLVVVCAPVDATGLEQLGVVFAPAATDAEQRACGACGAAVWADSLTLAAITWGCLPLCWTCAHREIVKIVQQEVLARAEEDECSPSQ